MLNWKSFWLGAGIGLIGGMITKGILEQKMYVSPEKALENAKKSFKNSGSISGSWIHMKPEHFEKDPLSYKVYKGGISRMNHDELEQYEFIADAKTGAIIETVKI